MWPAIIGAGAAIAGSLLGSKSQKDANQENIENQREFAQHGIRWKVEDAKAAGLHPLYALGGSGATFSPSSQPVFNGSELGQNLSRAALSATTPAQQQLHAANLKALEAAAEKDFAQASAFRSEAARINQQGGPAVPQADLDWMEAKGMGNPLVAQSLAVPDRLPDTPKPNPVAGPSYLTEGAKPGFQRFNTAVAGEVILPASSSMSEAVEAMENPAIQMWIIAENLKHYGKGADKKLRSILGDRYKWWTNPGGAVRDYLNSQRR